MRVALRHWWLARQPAELRLLALLLALLAGMWLFAAVAGEVREGGSRAFDERLLLALRDPGDLARGRGPAWLPAAAVDVTGLGSHAVVTLVLVASVGLLLFLRKPAMALLMVAAGTGGMWLNGALKHLFLRPRPTVVPHLVPAGSASFPSGHALLSAAVYLSLAVLLARLVRQRAIKIYLVVVGATLALLIGCTRIYLGVHYPTDVIAGWLAGGLWALACGMVALALQRRGKVEPAGFDRLTGSGGPAASG